MTFEESLSTVLARPGTWELLVDGNESWVLGPNSPQRGHAGVSHVFPSVVQTGVYPETVT